MATLTAEYPIETRPQCLSCRKPMSVCGTAKRRRWGCGGCDYTILFIGRGYGSSRERRRLLRVEFDSRPHDADLKLVVKHLKRGLVTVEELVAKVRLPEDEINLLCDLLVTQSQDSPDGYEWRAIGAKNRHGPRQRGIFRKDAPALVRSISPELKTPYMQTHAAAEGFQALADMSAKVRQHEANGLKGKRMPWETAEEYATRLKGKRRRMRTMVLSSGR